VKSFTGHSNIETVLASDEGRIYRIRDLLLPSHGVSELTKSKPPRQCLRAHTWQREQGDGKATLPKQTLALVDLPTQPRRWLPLLQV
jgi:hypothetical protein